MEKELEYENMTIQELKTSLESKCFYPLIIVNDAYPDGREALKIVRLKMDQEIVISFNRKKPSNEKYIHFRFQKMGKERIECSGLVMTSIEEIITTLNDVYDLWGIPIPTEKKKTVTQTELF